MLAISISHARFAALDADDRPVRSLPRDASLGEVAAPCPALRLVASPPARDTVLVVDDDGDLRLLLRAFLEDLGYSVLEAGDGLEALEILRSLDGEAVVVLADYWMPNMDGAELLRSILQDAALAYRHACALMTACAGWLPLPLRELLAQHDVQILAKPFRLAELEEIVRRCAARD
jgi:CheY-like chemotaxis protein